MLPRLLVLTTLVASVSFSSASALAEAGGEGGKPQAAPATEKPGNGKVNLHEVEIRGELEKPKIFFILPKAQRDAEAKQRRVRFYPDILEPLDKDRFEEEARVLYQHGIPAE